MRPVPALRAAARGAPVAGEGAWASWTGWVVALPALGLAAGLLLHGPWAAAGALAGVLAVLLARGLGVGPLGAGLAGLVPPLAAAGPLAMASVAALGMAWAWRRTGSPWVFAAGALGAALPGPGGHAVAAVGAAGLAATMPFPLLLVALPVGLAPAVGGSLPLPGLLAAMAGLGARWVAGHPANASMSDRLVQLGLLGAPAPAVVAYLFALVAQPEHFWAAGPAAAAAGLAGAAWMVAHVGLAVLLRSADGHPALWCAWTWCAPALALGLVVIVSPRAAFASSWAMAGLFAVPIGVAGAAMLAFARRAARVRWTRSEGLHPSRGTK